MKMQLKNLQISARELSAQQTEKLSKNSDKKQTTKINNASEDSSSMDFEGFDVRVSFDKDNSHDLSKQSDIVKSNKKTALHKMYDYNGNNKKVISNNFFDNIKPLMKSWKNRPKLNKVKTKDVGTSMENQMNIQTHLDEIKLINNFSKTPKSFNLKNKETQTNVNIQNSVNTQKFFKFDKNLPDPR